MASVVNNLRLIRGQAVSYPDLAVPVLPPIPGKYGYLEGTVTFEGQLIRREVNLFFELGSAGIPGNVSMPSNLVFLRRVFSDPNDGSWRIDNLMQGARYTVISCDSEGLLDPAIKSGLEVTPY